jgi:hypothetical protein
VVAGPAEAGALGFARFDGDGRLAAVGGDRVTMRIAVAAVADFARIVAGQTAVLGSRNSEQNVGPSTWSASAARISLVGSAIRATIEAHEHAQQAIIGEHVRSDLSSRNAAA